MQTHYVRKGDTMDAIARKYGLPNGMVVFYAPCNNNLRFSRSKPNLIQPGDLVFIPSNAVVETEKKLNNLKRVRADFLIMNEKILKEWNAEYLKVTRTASNVDIAGKVITIFIDLGSIIKDGLGTIKLSGQLLEQANKKLAYSAIKFAYDPLLNVAKEKAAESIGGVKSGDGLAIAMTKDVLHFFLVDWDTPSYWASKISGVDINETNRQVINEIETQKRNMLRTLDEQIAATELNLLKLKRVHNGASPFLY